jgi:RsiW-degrading membrane proteinase PrsW (M82 family)
MKTVRILHRRDGQPRLVLPGLAVLMTAFLVALGVSMLAARPRTDEQRAKTLSRSSSYALAEAIYVRLLAERPSVPVLLEFLSNHRSGVADEENRRQTKGLGSSAAEVMDEDALAALLGALPEDLLLVARFVAEEHPPASVQDAVVAGARRDPPVPWYNHLLAEAALQEGRPSEAAAYFEREGLAFRERSRDVDKAVAIWMDSDDWDEVRRRMSDPRVASATGPETHERFAEHERDWPSAMKWFALAWRGRLTLFGLGMSGTAALAWGFFCSRLGKLAERPGRRLAFYVIAFGLGVLSIVPTVLLITVEEIKLRLVETGDPLRDILFFVFGVGLREEASKLLLFAFLLPVLRKWGDKLDVLVCGAMVGLGFAAEENLGYLTSGDLHTGLGRFLTANFLHIAMTGVLATALDDLVGDPERQAPEFSRTALMVISLHGAYDFLLSHEELGGSFMAMAVFVFLTRLFLGAVERARKRVDRGLSPLHAFVLAAAVVTGVSAAYATLAVGPLNAVFAMAEGLLGEAIIFAMFVGTLRAM